MSKDARFRILCAILGFYLGGSIMAILIILGVFR